MVKPFRSRFRSSAEALVPFDPWHAYQILKQNRNCSARNELGLVDAHGNIAKTIAKESAAQQHDQAICASHHADICLDVLRNQRAANSMVEDEPESAATGTSPQKVLEKSLPAKADSRNTVGHLDGQRTIASDLDRLHSAIACTTPQGQEISTAAHTTTVERPSWLPNNDYMRPADVANVQQAQMVLVAAVPSENLAKEIRRGREDYPSASRSDEPMRTDGAQSQSQNQILGHEGAREQPAVKIAHREKRRKFDSILRATALQRSVGDDGDKSAPKLTFGFTPSSAASSKRQGTTGTAQQRLQLESQITAQDIAASPTLQHFPSSKDADGCASSSSGIAASMRDYLKLNSTTKNKNDIASAKTLQKPKVGRLTLVPDLTQAPSDQEANQVERRRTAPSRPRPRPQTSADAGATNIIGTDDSSIRDAFYDLPGAPQRTKKRKLLSITLPSSSKIPSRK